MVRVHAPWMKVGLMRGVSGAGCSVVGGKEGWHCVPKCNSLPLLQDNMEGRASTDFEDDIIPAPHTPSLTHTRTCSFFLTQDNMEGRARRNPDFEDDVILNPGVNEGTAFIVMDV